MPRATVDEGEGAAARAVSGVPGGRAKLPRILGPRRRPPGVEGDDTAPAVMFVGNGFADAPEEDEGPVEATFTDWSPPESLFYQHEAARRVEHPVAPTPHAALGVDPDASWSEIRTAYRELVTRLHPDRHVTAPEAEQRAAAEQLAEVNVAYHALQKERRRRE